MEIAIPAALAAPTANPVLDHELHLLRSAVALVEADGAPRVTLVGMRSGGGLIARALTMGASAGLVVRARWWPEGEAFDLVVERHG
jgi:hypothetical protein